MPNNLNNDPEPALVSAFYGYAVFVIGVTCLMAAFVSGWFTFMLLLVFVNPRIVMGKWPDPYPIPDAPNEDVHSVKTHLKPPYQT